MEGCAHARRLLLGGVRRHVRPIDLLGGGRVKSIRDYSAPAHHHGISASGKKASRALLSNAGAVREPRELVSVTAYHVA